MSDRERRKGDSKGMGRGGGAPNIPNIPNGYTDDRKVCSDACDIERYSVSFSAFSFCIYVMQQVGGCVVV